MTDKRPIVILICGYMRTGKSTVAEILSDQYGCPIYSFADPLKAVSLDTLDMFRYNMRTLGWLDYAKNQGFTLLTDRDRMLMTLIWMLTIIAMLLGNATTCMMAILVVSLFATYYYVYERNRELTARKVLVNMGAILRKHIGANVFIDAVCAKIDAVVEHLAAGEPRKIDPCGSGGRVSGPIAIVGDCRFVPEIAEIHKRDKYDVRLIYIRRFDGDTEVVAPTINATEMPSLIVDYAISAGIRIYRVINDGTMNDLRDNIRALAM